MKISKEGRVNIRAIQSYLVHFSNLEGLEAWIRIGGHISTQRQLQYH